MELSHHEILNQAAAGYQAKHTDASDEDVKAFLASVERRLASRVPRNNRAVKEERKQRRAAVVEKIKANNLHVFSIRRLDIEASTLPDRRIFHPTGGVTIAYREEEGHTTFSMSVCSMKDRFDDLDGRERAVTRMLTGVTIQTPGTAVDADPEHLFNAYLNLLRRLSDARTARAHAEAGAV